MDLSSFDQTDDQHFIGKLLHDPLSLSGFRSDILHPLPASNHHNELLSATALDLENPRRPFAELVLLKHKSCFLYPVDSLEQ